jgi:hypothetical protein
MSTDRRAVLGFVFAAPACSAGRMPLSRAHASHGEGEPIFTNFGDVPWEKFSPDQPDTDLARIAILHTTANGATQLLIKTPGDYYIPRHWHSANETHTIIRGAYVFEHSDAEGHSHRIEQGVGSFNYMPARMVHRAWSRPGEEAVLFITVDGPWDINFVPDQQTTPPGTDRFRRRSQRIDGLRHIRPRGLAHSCHWHMT